MAEESLAVEHHPERNAFEIDLDGQRAVLEYHRRAGSIVFTHTGVPPEFEGRGIGGKLVKAGLDWARGEKAKVVPACSFVHVYLKRHPEYADLMGGS
jgi:predicted GNAT family acetyltransferase